MDNYLTVAEVARLCKVTEQTVRNWNKAGLIQFETRTYDKNTPIKRGHGHYKVHIREYRMLAAAMVKR